MSSVAFGILTRTILGGGAPAAGFQCGSAVFDGGTDFLTRGSDLTGASDGDKGTVSFWIKMGDLSSDVASYYIYSNTSNRVAVLRDGSGKIVIQGNTAVPAAILSIESSANSVVKSSGWVHVEASWDLSIPVAHLNIDGVDDLTTNFALAGDLDYTRDEHEIGAVAPTDTNKLNGSLSEFYFNFDEYVNLSALSPFLNGGLPKDLGSDGSTPTGTVPILYHKFLEGALATNLGSGGGMTENGSLTFGGSDNPCQVTKVREGILGYASTKDTFLDEGVPAAVNGASTTCTVERLTGRGLSRAYTLVQFRDLDTFIGSGRTVTSATLRLFIFNTIVGANAIEIFQLTDATKGAWLEATASWNVVGEVIFGTDTPASSEVDFTGDTAGEVLVTLPNALVQAWHDDDSTNYGIVMRTLVENDGFVFYSSEELADLTRRPTLTVEHE